MASGLDADVIARQVINQKRRLNRRVPPQVDLATSITAIQIADTINGSSTLTVTVADQEWRLLDSGFFDADRDGRLDAVDLNYPDDSRLWWRLTQCNPRLADQSVELVFMERAAVFLMHHHGPRKANRAGHTRAEFIKSLVDVVKAGGGLDFHSRELHVVQPISGGAVTGLPRSPIGKVFIEGDSLAVGSDPGVKSRLGSGWTVTTDAAVGRTTSTGRANILAQSDLPPVLVVELGTNDHGIADATWRGYIDDIVSHAGASRHVVWVNLKGDGIDYSSMNASLDAKAGEHANLVVLDWAGLVNSESIPLDATLHVHPDSAGYRKRAKLIADALKDPRNTEGGSAKLSAAERRQAKNKGLTPAAVKGIKVDGRQLDEDQRRNIEIALTVAEDSNAGDLATLAMVCAGFGEGFVPGKGGWHDVMEGNSVPVERWKANPNGPWGITNGYGGVLQGQVAKHDSNWFGQMDSETRTQEEAKSFLHGGRGYQGGGAIYLAHQNPTMSPGTIAEKVEASGVNVYDHFRDASEKIIQAWGGASPGTGSPTYRKKYNFLVGRHEDFWDACLRLAEEVNWPFFLDGSDVYYDPETQLIRQQPVAVIDRGDAALIDFDITWDERKIATEATLTLICDPFEFRAGEVFMLTRLGPASTGSTARPKPLPGRWLIESFDRDRYAATTSFTLKQPDPPRKEPAPDIATRDSAGDANVQRDSTGYVDPFAKAKSLVVGQVDMGQDYAMAPGSPILAFGDSKLLDIFPNWYRGQPFMLFHVLNGPRAGDYWYLAEQITPALKRGQTVKAGEVVAHYATSGTAIEMGWASGKGTETLAQKNGHGAYAIRHAPGGTAEGRDWAAFIDRVRRGRLANFPDSHGGN